MRSKQQTHNNVQACKLNVFNPAKFGLFCANNMALAISESILHAEYKSGNTLRKSFKIKQIYFKIVTRRFSGCRLLKNFIQI